MYETITEYLIIIQVLFMGFPMLLMMASTILYVIVQNQEKRENK